MKTQIIRLCTFLALGATVVAAAATTYNIAPFAGVSSSGDTEGFPATAATDGRARFSGRWEWHSASTSTPWGQIAYPWLRLEWDEPQTIERIILYDTPDRLRHTAAVTLHFSDSTSIDVNSIDNGGSPRVVDFPAKTVTWIKAEVTDADGTEVGLSEIEVYAAVGSAADCVSKVNPYIETARGRYFFFATGSLPFGMISAAPLTRNKNQYGGGYNYNSTEILGFPQLHDWMMGALTLMPVTGEVDPLPGENSWKSRFSHDGEIVRPGYHRLHLDRYGMWVEQTATDRVALYRCSCTETAKEVSMLFNLQGYVGTTTMVSPRAELTDSTTITGELTTTGRLWGGPDSVRVYFAAKFNRPVRSLDSWSRRGIEKNVLAFSSDDIATRRFPDEFFSYWDAPSAGVRANFGDLAVGDSVMVKIAVSYVSRRNALENMEKECAGWDFSSVCRTAQSVWNEQLARIEVTGGTSRQQEKFYTDLWHVLLGRHKINDINGEYPDYTAGRRDGAYTRDIAFRSRRLPMNPDGSPRFNMYNSDAFWLTQWNLNVLWGLAWPEVLDDFAACLVQYAENGGLIPRGPNMGGYSYIMTACPGTSLIVSAFQKGMLTKTDPKKAYRHIVNNHCGGGMMGTTDEIAFYEKNGYFSGNAGITLEAAFQDWALSEMAAAMGKKKDAARFRRRASGWPALFNPEIGLIMPKDGNGEWLHNDPLNGWGWVEANAWQATWSVSHQLDRLASLMGGRDSMAAKLDHAFRMAAPENFLSGYANGYISYANQPGLSDAHVFNRIGYGHLSQKWVRRVQEKAYGYTSPDRGYGGHDEDQGQMGATSALMAIGLFSVTGTVEREPVYDVTSPVFDTVRIKLQKPYYKGDSLVIRTVSNSGSNCLIRSADFNGTALDPASALIPHSALAAGGTLTVNLMSEDGK